MTELSLLRRAQRQHGVFTRSQALRSGLSAGAIAHRLRKRRWECLYSGVYRLVGSPTTWRQSLLAACFAWAGVASHRAAAALWSFPGFPQGVVEVVAPRTRRRTIPGAHAHWLGDIPKRDVVIFDGIPVTRPARTLVDLAAIVTTDVLEVALDDALTRGLVTLPLMVRQLAGRPTSPGTAALRKLVAVRARAGHPRSFLETKLVRAVIAEKLEGYVLQYPLELEGRLVVLDVAFPDVRIAVEADGHRFHSSLPKWERDLDRRNLLTIGDWRILHATKKDIEERPMELRRRIRELVTRARATLSA